MKYYLYFVYLLVILEAKRSACKSPDTFKSEFCEIVCVCVKFNSDYRQFQVKNNHWYFPYRHLFLLYFGAYILDESWYFPQYFVTHRREKMKLIYLGFVLTLCLVSLVEAANQQPQCAKKGEYVSCLFIICLNIFVYRLRN